MKKVIISADFYTKLVKAWHDGANMTEIRIMIKNEFGFGKYMSGEKILLYGNRECQDIFSEQHIGVLESFVPGVVLLVDEYSGSIGQSFSGLLERGINASGEIFCLKPFWSRPGDSTGLSIGQANHNIQTENIYYVCSAEIDTFSGGGRDVYRNIYGISENRWVVLNTWLKKWLP